MKIKFGRKPKVESRSHLRCLNSQTIISYGDYILIPKKEMARADYICNQCQDFILVGEEHTIYYKVFPKIED